MPGIDKMVKNAADGNVSDDIQKIFRTAHGYGGVENNDLGPDEFKLIIPFGPLGKFRLIQALIYDFHQFISHLFYGSKCNRIDHAKTFRQGFIV